MSVLPKELPQSTLPRIGRFTVLDGEPFYYIFWNSSLYSRVFKLKLLVYYIYNGQAFKSDDLDEFYTITVTMTCWVSFDVYGFSYDCNVCDTTDNV